MGSGLLASYFLSIEPVITPVTVESVARLSAWKNDGLAFCEQWIILGFGFLTGFSILDSPADQRNASRFGGFLIFALAGLMLIAASNDFLALGLSLEVVSLSIAALQRQMDLQPDNGVSLAAPNEGPADSPSANIWFSRLSSAWMWLGIALLSNATATTNFDELQSVLTESYDPAGDQRAIGAPSKLILLSSGLIAISLFARMGLVPFHLGFFATIRRRSQWISLCALMISQLAGAMTLTRLFGYVFVGLSQSFVVLAIVIALATFALSMTVALRGLSPGTQSVRDLVTSLILLQGGWLIVGTMIVAVELDHPTLRWGAFPGQPESVAIIVFAQIISILSACGICSALTHLARADRRIEFLEDVKGLGHFAPLTSIALLAPLASIAACPWTAGFYSRWLTLVAGHNIHVKSTSNILTPHYGIRVSILAGVLTTVAFIPTSIRLTREMLLESPLARHVATGGRRPLIVSLMTAVATLFLGVAPHLALGPLKIISSPRTVSPRDPERGSGRNSLGMKEGPRGSDSNVDGGRN